MYVKQVWAHPYMFPTAVLHLMQVELHDGAAGKAGLMCLRQGTWSSLFGLGVVSGIKWGSSERFAISCRTLRSYTHRVTDQWLGHPHP